MTLRRFDRTFFGFPTSDDRRPTTDDRRPTTDDRRNAPKLFRLRSENSSDRSFNSFLSLPEFESMPNMEPLKKRQQRWASHWHSPHSKLFNNELKLENLGDCIAHSFVFLLPTQRHRVRFGMTFFSAIFLKIFYATEVNRQLTASRVKCAKCLASRSNLSSISVGPYYKMLGNYVWTWIVGH